VGGKPTAPPGSASGRGPRSDVGASWAIVPDDGEGSRADSDLRGERVARVRAEDRLVARAVGFVSFTMVDKFNEMFISTGFNRSKPAMEIDSRIIFVYNLKCRLRFSESIECQFIN
jgi:hypothetical protein